jgi:hypothetical protein
MRTRWPGYPTAAPTATCEEPQDSVGSIRSRLIGLSSFRSPEILRGHEFGEQTDTFSFGILVRSCRSADLACVSDRRRYGNAARRDHVQTPGREWQGFRSEFAAQCFKASAEANSLADHRRLPALRSYIHAGRRRSTTSCKSRLSSCVDRPSVALLLRGSSRSTDHEGGSRSIAGHRGRSPC